MSDDKTPPVHVCQEADFCAAADDVCPACRDEAKTPTPNSGATSSKLVVAIDPALVALRKSVAARQYTHPLDVTRPMHCAACTLRAYEAALADRERVLRERETAEHQRIQAIVDECDAAIGDEIQQREAAEAKLREVEAALDVYEDECTPTLGQRIRTILAPASCKLCGGAGVLGIGERCLCRPSTTTASERPRHPRERQRS